MAKISAGILLTRVAAQGREVLLVHPGGPFWAKKDDGAWSIPKGEAADGEDLAATARREVAEEIGFAPDGPAVSLGCVRQAGGKVVHAWAIEADFDPAMLHSNTFSMEWPPRSGHRREFPEVDRAAWFSLPRAREKILAGQRPFLDRLEAATADAHRPRRR